MKKTKRSDKKKNMAKVAEALAKNPHGSVREIARATQLWSSTVHRASQELGQNGTKDETISYIVGSAKNRLKRLSWLLDRAVDEIENKEILTPVDVKNIREISRDDQARIERLWGTITDEQGWLIEQDLTDKQLRAIESILWSIL